MKQNIILSLNINENVHYISTDTDEAKERANDLELIGKMYCGYVSSNSNVEEFNMHTKSGVGVDKDKISRITTHGDDSAISILKEIYSEEKEKDKNLEFAFLDRFMCYVNSMNSNIKL